MEQNDPTRQSLTQSAGRMQLIADQGSKVLDEVARLRKVSESQPIPDYAGAQQLFEQESLVHEVSVFGTRLHHVVDDAPGVRARVLERLQGTGNVPATVERIVPSLEDVFIHAVEVAS